MVTVDVDHLEGQPPSGGGAIRLVVRRQLVFDAPAVFQMELGSTAVVAVQDHHVFGGFLGFVEGRGRDGNGAGRSGCSTCSSGGGRKWGLAAG